MILSSNKIVAIERRLFSNTEIPLPVTTEAGTTSGHCRQGSTASSGTLKTPSKLSSNITKPRSIHNSNSRYTVSIPWIPGFLSCASHVRIVFSQIEFVHWLAARHSAPMEGLHRFRQSIWSRSNHHDPNSSTHPFGSGVWKQSLCNRIPRLNKLLRLKSSRDA